MPFSLLAAIATNDSRVAAKVRRWGEGNVGDVSFSLLAAIATNVLSYSCLGNVDVCQLNLSMMMMMMDDDDH